MKYLFFLALSIYTCQVTFGQNKNYKITYRHNLQFDTLKMLQDTIGMEAILIGNNLESNYTFAKRPKNIPVNPNIPVMTAEDVIKNKKSGTFTVTTKNKGYDSIGNMVYQNKKTNVTLVREKMMNDYIVTEEETPKLKWEITEDVKVIKNYVCKKATTHFRGRDYTAWFTTDLPIVAGPWKFKGLPGLILDIEDSKFQVKIYVEKVEFPSNEKVPVFVNDGIKIELDKYFSYRNDEFIKHNIGVQELLMKQNNMSEIIAAGGAMPKATFTGRTMYDIELRKD